MFTASFIQTIRNFRPIRALSGGLLILMLCLLAACGGGTATSSTNSSNDASRAPANGGSANQPQAPPVTTSDGHTKSNQPNSPTGPQYLIKSLKIDMQVKDTRKVAADLQSWIITTDPRASSTGMDYEQISDNTYNVNITFSVQATLYPQIQNYLRDYAPLHGGKLVDLHESVQDVSNDYIDTQSRLRNLKGEQERLLTLLSHAQALSDILTIEQRLTDVEGQIEQTEAHMSALSGQVAFYTIALGLTPSQSILPPPPETGWSATQILHDAWTAALSVGQALLAILLWLLAFSIYIVPLTLIILLILRQRNRRLGLSRPTLRPAGASSVPPPPAGN